MLDRQEAEQSTQNKLSFIDKLKRQYDLTPSITVVLGLTTLFFLLFLIYPLLYVFKEAFWIENKFNLVYFKLMVTDPNIRELVINSFKIGVMVTLITSVVSLPLAYFLTRFRYPGRDTLRAIISDSDDYAAFRGGNRHAAVLRLIRERQYAPRKTEPD